MSLTPNMNLTLPTVSATPGPEYATENNSAFEVIDAHDHTSGNGVQIPSAGINIDDTLSMNSENLTNVNSVRFTNLSNALGGAANIGCAYVAGGNLFYNDSSGTQIQLTAGGALNAASVGGIGGDYGSSTASVYYTSIDETFYFTSDTNVPANINVGSAVIREPAVSSNSITVKSAASLASSYNLTLPATLPGSTSVVSLSATGTLATGVAGTVAANDLAANSVITAKIADGAVTLPKLAAVGQQLSSGSGAFTTTSAVAVAVTGTSVSLTTVGRPVVLKVTTGSIGGLSVNSTVDVFFGFFRNGAPVSSSQIYMAVSSGTAYKLDAGSSLSTVDVPGAGTYTYAVYCYANGAGSTAVANSIQLMAYEI